MSKLRRFLCSYMIFFKIHLLTRSAIMLKILIGAHDPNFWAISWNFLVDLNFGAQNRVMGLSKALKSSTRCSLAGSFHICLSTRCFIILGSRSLHIYQFLAPGSRSLPSHVYCHGNNLPLALWGSTPWIKEMKREKRTWFIILFQVSYRNWSI